MLSETNKGNILFFQLLHGKDLAGKCRCNRSPKRWVSLTHPAFFRVKPISPNGIISTNGQDFHFQVTARLWQVGAGAIDCTLDIVANIKMSVSRMMTAASVEDALILMPLQLPKNSVSANSDILALDVLKVSITLQLQDYQTMLGLIRYQVRRNLRFLLLVKGLVIKKQCFCKLGYFGPGCSQGEHYSLQDYQNILGQIRCQVRPD